MTKLTASILSMNAPARLTVPRHVWAISSCDLHTPEREGGRKREREKEKESQCNIFQGGGGGKPIF